MRLLFSLIVILITPSLSACWVTEQCGLPGDEDGDGLENCEDPDCAAREICGGLAPIPVGPVLVDDDDDSTDTDDDDSTDTNGDGPPVDGYSFNLDWEFTAIEGDDDDSAPAPRHVVEGRFEVTYWSDLENGVELCTQRLRIEGDATFGDGLPPSEVDANDGCSVCTGHVLFDPGTATDVSAPAEDPDDCDPAELSELGGDLGSLLLTPPGSAGLGDFLEFAVIDAETLAAAGIEPSPASPGADRTHAAYVLVTPDSLADRAGLTTSTNPVEAGSPWYGAFELVGEPGPVLGGAVEGRGLFVFVGSF